MATLSGEAPLSLPRSVALLRLRTQGQLRHIPAALGRDRLCTPDVAEEC